MWSRPWHASRHRKTHATCTVPEPVRATSKPMSSASVPVARSQIQPLREKLLALLPRVPLAVMLGFVGSINILDGLRLPLAKLQSITALSSLEGSLSAVGGTA